MGQEDDDLEDFMGHKGSSKKSSKLLLRNSGKLGGNKNIISWGLQ